MAFSEHELRRYERDIARFLARRRPSEHIRPELDIDVRLTGHSVQVFEIRPDWQDRTKKMETPVAKATFIRTRNRWRVFWMRRDLKWHGYGPNLEVHSLEAVFNVVDRDEFCCFFG